MQAITAKPRVFVKHRKPTKMPRLTRETLAHKFRQNWMAKHPGDSPASGLDDSLTSLNWLQNLNIMKITTPTPPASPTPLVENTRQLRVNPNSVLNMTNLPPVKQEPGLIQPTPIFPGMPETVNPPTTTSPVDMIDYKTNPYVKPPYSYATLICMAMKESKKNKITLSGIYNWITDNFMYYRVADPSWQNSIRHNLSLNKSFQKVPRRKDEPGKGGFWRINPDYVDMLENGILRRRRSSARENIAPTLPVKRLKTDQDDTRPMKSQCTNANQSRNRVDTAAVKVEPIHEDSRLLHMGDVSSGLDFSWSSILTQDIDVGGIKIKTEDIINETEQAANTITALSPPPSDSNSDVSLDDLLSADLGGADMDAPLDLTTGHDLDLTVQGQSIKAPDWWSESLNGALDISGRSGLHTPIAPSPVPEEIQESHPWAENKSCVDQAMCAFDIDIQSLFDFDGHNNGSH